MEHHLIITKIEQTDIRFSKSIIDIFIVIDLLESYSPSEVSTNCNGINISRIRNTSAF